MELIDNILEVEAETLSGSQSDSKDEELLAHPFQCGAVLASTQGQQELLTLASRDHIYQIGTASWKLKAQWSNPVANQSPITLLEASKDKLYLAAVSGEDKTVHIFESDGLKHLRAVAMPKRPCALSFLPDNSHILCGDKFGDVYALPLDPEENYDRPSKKPRVNKSNAPAATNLTVHTRGNLRTLEHQHKLAEAKRAKNEAIDDNVRDESFPYEPILGHVSMLTDICVAQTSSNSNSSPSKSCSPRTYVFSADRDEHIRISRGPPQAHVIEGYCLGHVDFVSKLCLIRDNILISGGGDNFLCVWDWLNQTLLSTPDLGTDMGTITDGTKFAVRDLKPYSVGENFIGVFCASDGVAQLSYLQCHIEHVTNRWRFTETLIPLRGNALNINVLCSHTRGPHMLAVAIDNVHVGDTKVRVRLDDCPRLQIFTINRAGASITFQERTTSQESGIEDRCEPHAQGIERGSGGPSLSSLLYQTENLRKRKDGSP